MLFVKLCLCLCILLLGVSDVVLAARKEPVKSTQGIEISQDVEKTLKTPAKQRKEQRRKKRNSDYYIKNKKQLDKLDMNKKMKQKELEFWQNRLEIKKQKLEDFTSSDRKGDMK